MAIGVLNPQILNFQQANPFIEGMQSGDTLANDTLQQQLNMLKMKNQAIQNQYLPQTIQEKIQNAITSGKLMQAQIPETQARTNLTNVQAKFEPLRQLIAAQNSTNSMSRFGAAYQLSRTLQNMAAPARQAWIAQHQDEYNQMLSDLGAKNNNQQSLITPELLKQFFPNLTTNQPQASGTPTQNIKETLGNALNAGAPQNQPFASTPEQTAQTQLANELAANKELTTGASRTRYEGAISASNLLNQPVVNKSFNVLSNYSGLEGKTRAQLQRLMNPEEWADYSSAANQLSGILSGSIKALESMPTSNEGLRKAQNFFEQAQDALWTSPKAAMKFYNNGRELLDAEAKSLQATANPLFNVNRLPESKPFTLNNSKADPLGIR